MHNSNNCYIFASSNKNKVVTITNRTMKKIKFEVSVIGCNAATFYGNYKDYVIDQVPSYYDNMTFTLNAPQNIYDEIKGLNEEGIEIVK